MSKCFVTNCTSGYKSNSEKVSIFKAPNDSVLLEKWQKAIPRLDRILTSKDRVCEKHFLPNEVIKDWKAEKDGVIVMQGKRRAKLSPTAVPSQFPGLPQYLSKKETKSRKPPTPRNLDIIKRKKSKKNTTVEETVTVINDQYSSTDDDLQVYSEPAKLSFEHLRNSASSMRLPSTMWRVHITDGSCFRPPTLSFICTGVNHIDRRMVILKQVCFDEYLNVKAFILNKHVTLAQLGFGEAMSTISLEEVSTIIQVLHDRSMCRGGPKLTEYKGVQPETAYADEWGTWRHIRCTFLCEEKFFQCPACSSLDNTLRIQLSRKKTRSTQKRIRIPRCPEKKVHLFKIMCRTKARQGTMLKRSQALTKKLKETIKNLQKKIGEISEEKLKEKLEKLNLPPAQLTVITECVSAGQLASKNSRRYTREFLLMCLMLHIRSPKSYQFILDQEILPLPCVKTIRNYLSKVKSQCGFDTEFFEDLKKKLSQTTKNESQEILLHDEMQVSGSMEVSSPTLSINGFVDFGPDRPVLSLGEDHSEMSEC